MVLPLLAAFLPAAMKALGGALVGGLVNRAVNPPKSIGHQLSDLRYGAEAAGFNPLTVLGSGWSPMSEGNGLVGDTAAAALGDSLARQEERDAEERRFAAVREIAALSPRAYGAGFFDEATLGLDANTGAGGESRLTFGPVVTHGPQSAAQDLENRYGSIVGDVGGLLSFGRDVVVSANEGTRKLPGYFPLAGEYMRTLDTYGPQSGGRSPQRRSTDGSEDGAVTPWLMW